jgi:hypothetical protein
MARQLRLEYPDALNHLTARGNEQHLIFHDDIDRQHFLRLFGQEILQQHWRCYAYCLMGHHFRECMAACLPAQRLAKRRPHKLIRCD